MKNTTEVNGKIVIIVMAIVVYVLVFQGVARAQMNNMTGLDNPMTRAKNASIVIKHASEFNLEAKAVPMNSSINSPYAELKPAMAPDGKRMYFSRIFHPDNTVGERDNEDIWYCDYDTIAEAWSYPAVLTGSLNNAGPNFVNSISISGDTLILGNQYLKNGKMRAGLSYSVNMEGRWSDPVSIHVRNDYNIAEHANHCVSLKTGVIISAVQRVETAGGRDLYVSFWDGEEATEPVNMGSVINSELDESSPFLASDNKTLFFASKGHNGYGGFDIFATTRLDETWTNWSEPKNLGRGVNGPLNDEHFVITHCKQYAIFSKQVSIHNVDLFRVAIHELYKLKDQEIVKMKIEAAFKKSSMASL